MWGGSACGDDDGFWWRAGDGDGGSGDSGSGGNGGGGGDVEADGDDGDGARQLVFDGDNAPPRNRARTETDP